MALHVGWGSRRMLVALSAGSVKEGKPRGHTQDTGRAGSGGGSVIHPGLLAVGPLQGTGRWWLLGLARGWAWGRDAMPLEDLQ